jgi:hypothetical protein
MRNLTTDTPIFSQPSKACQVGCDPQALVILGGEIGHKNLWLLDLRTGARRILAELPADFVIRDFDISAAGSEIVFDRVQMTSDLALIERTH